MLGVFQANLSQGVLDGGALMQAYAEYLRTLFAIELYPSHGSVVARAGGAGIFFMRAGISAHQTAGWLW